MDRGARRRRLPGAAASLLRDYVGRPSPLYLAERLSAEVGHPVYLKREDLNHTGAHKINNALGQALLAQRMGKTRIIAETGAGQHGVASATACALLDLECIVYMGTEDIRRQRPNVQRMELLGATSSRRRRRPHAEGGRLGGDPRLGHQRRRHPLHHRLGVGPAPYPVIVRELQRIIGDEARAQMLEQAGRLPDARDRLRRRRLQLDRHFHRFCRRCRGQADRRRGRRGRDRDRPPRRAAHRRRAGRACCTAPTQRSCRTRTARSSRRTRSQPASTIPAPAPSTLGCGIRAARATWPSPTSRRCDAFAQTGPARGHHPGAGERACARLDAGQPGQRARCASASPAAATRIWPRRSTSSDVGSSHGA